MSALGKAIYTILTADGDVNALVSGRVYPDIRPQDTDTVPAVTYMVTSRVPQHTKDTAGVTDETVEMVLMGTSYSEVNDLSDKIQAALDRYAIGSTVSGVVLDGVQLEESDDDDWDIEAQTEDIPIYMKTERYAIRVK